MTPAPNGKQLVPTQREQSLREILDPRASRRALSVEALIRDTTDSSGAELVVDRFRVPERG